MYSIRQGLIKITGIVLLLLATACALLDVIPGQQTPAPAWYTNPPADTEDFLYGTGKQTTVDAATKDALVAIASKLGVDVGSTESIQLSSAGGAGTLASRQDISMSVGNTKLSNFRVQETIEDKSNQEHWVLVVLDKKAMSKDLQTSINQLKTEVDHDFNRFKSMSNLNQVIASGDLNRKLDTLAKNATTYNQLDRSYDPANIQNYVNGKKNLLVKSRDRLQVRVQHDSNTRELAKKIRGLLNEKNIKVVDSAGIGTTSFVLNGNVKYFEILSDHQARLDVSIKAVDDSGKVLATSEFTESGASPRSKESALLQANQKMAKLFEEQGLLAPLGI